MAGSPIALGYRPDALVDLASRHAHVRDIDMVIELKTGELITSKSFNAAYGHLLKNPYGSFIKWPRTPKVARIDYLPGENDLFVQTDTGVVLNTWLPGEIIPAAGSFATIEELMLELFPVEAEREHLLTLLAFVLQRPGQKVNHIVVITGPQGTGKSSFTKLVLSMVGRKNGRVVEGQVLAGRFWSDLYACQLLIIEEVSLSDRRDVGNRMKPLITERTGRVEAKFIKEREMRSPDLILMVSNHKQPVVLEESDRRTFATTWGAPKRESAFFDRLNKALPAETPAFMAHLMARDISAFNPAAPPPMTDAKRAMASDSIPEPRRYLAELVEAEQGIYAKDLLIVGEVAMDLRGGGFPNMNVIQTGKLLAGIGGESLGQLPLGNRWQGQPRVWAIRNQDVWRAATRTQLGEYMRDRHLFT
ncbi:DEXSc_RecD-like domain containing protein [Caulobacteraceae bacterium]